MRSLGEVRMGSAGRRDRTGPGGSCRRGRCEADSSLRYGALDTTSPPFRVPIAIQVARLMLLGMNCTWPSTKHTITPPVWWLVAARLFPFSDQFGGWEPVISPCDWWCTQKNWLHPLPSKHQLWLAQLDFSREVHGVAGAVGHVGHGDRAVDPPHPVVRRRSLLRSGQHVSAKFARPES